MVNQGHKRLLLKQVCAQGHPWENDMCNTIFLTRIQRHTNQMNPYNEPLLCVCVHVAQ